MNKETSTLIQNRNHIKVKSTRDLQHYYHRRREGTFIAEGIRFLHQALEHGAHIEYLVWAPSLLKNAFGRKLVQKVSTLGIPALQVTAEVFQSLSLAEEPHGVMCVIRQRQRKLKHIKETDGLCWIALSDVHSPGNLGTILRCANAVNAAGVILVGDEVDPYSPGCVRASMGSMFTQKFVRCRLEELVEWKFRQNYFLLGTAPAAALDYQTVQYPPNSILFMGSERKGLTEAEKQACDALVSIPMSGRLDSLNLAMATTLLLYEVFNQHRHRAMN